MAEIPRGTPQECKVAPYGIAKTQLQALRADIERQSKPLDKTRYNLARTPVTPPAAGVDVDTLWKQRVAGSLQALGLTNVPEDFSYAVVQELKRGGANLADPNIVEYMVHQGEFYLISSDNKTVAFTSILPWEALSDNMELTDTLRVNYDLGKYNYATPATYAFARIEGSVDKTVHIDRKRDLQWYKDKKSAAYTMMRVFNDPALKNLFDASTQVLIDANKDMLNDLAGFDPAKIRPDFENKYTKDQVFGANGVYNIVLGFQRILSVINDWSPGAFANRKSVLTINMGLKVKEPNERYTLVQDLTCVGAPPPGEIISPPSQIPEEETQSGPFPIPAEKPE